MSDHTNKCKVPTEIGHTPGTVTYTDLKDETETEEEAKEGNYR